MHPFSNLAQQTASSPRMLASAKGIFVTDADGREYIDAGSGLWCVNVGYGREEIAEVMAEQSRKLSYGLCFGNYSNEPLIELAEKLLRLAPEGMCRVLFNNSGSEANDAQIKIVRAYNNLLGRPAKKKFISRHGAYHGSSLGSGSLTGHPVVHQHFDLPMAGVLHAAAPDYFRRADRTQSEAQFCAQLVSDLEAMIEREGPETVAAFIAEPVMGSCGVIIPPDGYFTAVQELLVRHDILLIADEVITGFGRLGHWFGSTPMGLKPDLVTCAKGITSGYFPMSACLVGERVWSVLAGDPELTGVFGHGVTTAGHPVAAAVALQNLKIIEREGLLENAESTGGYLLQAMRQALLQHELVGDIRGIGMMCGIELDEDKASHTPFGDQPRVAALFNACCWEEGLIVRGGHGKVMAALAPPLSMTRPEADETVARMHRALARMANQLSRTASVAPCHMLEQR
jgi:L-2,4-diaminobutyrate transaminase